MIPFIDIHTHFAHSENGVVSVQNFHQKEWENGLFTEGVGLASVGLHPWFLTVENFENDFKKLAQLVENQFIIAIGECGLDKIKGTDFNFQMYAFERQIRLAESVSKPVVVHCVKAFNEVISIKKRLNPKVPIIIHGFNQNEIILKELIKNDFFISVGAAILREQNVSNAAKNLRNIPLNRLFFETDDKKVAIQKIYEMAANILEVNVSDLKIRIRDNFETTFKVF